jgi:zinc/manganese transport system substrate-binding protein
MAKVARAQVFLMVGLGLDRWANAIVDGSRNAKLQLVDCSAGVHVLERPAGRVDASMGDVHPHGNPHYWLDPRNGAIVARNVAEAFARADPAHAAGYRERAEAFAREAQAAWEQAAARAQAIPARVLFTYHRSWSYFADAFGFEVVDTIEPVPGIPPTARHLADLVAQAKARGVKLLLQEPYFASDGGRFLERQAGVQPVVQSTSCAEPVAGSYLRHFDEILGVLEQAR